VIVAAKRLKMRADAGERVNELRTQALARGHSPGFTDIFRQEWPGVERERRLHGVEVSSASTSIERRLRQPLLERPGVHPALLTIDAEAAVLLSDETTVAKQPPQAQQRYA